MKNPTWLTKKSSMTLLLLFLACTLPLTTLAVGCPEDLDGDNQVAVDDILLLIGSWGSCPSHGNCSADLNDDDVVDVNDLLLMIGAWGACPPDEPLFNYAEALQQAIMFYDYQRSGEIPEYNRAQWRGDSFLTVGKEQVNAGPFDVNLANRYMDAGDTGTYVLPISSGMTLLSWSAIQWKDGYEATGQFEHMKNVLRWHADWCIEAHPFPNVFCGQVGDGAIGNNFFGAPEIHPNYIPRVHWLTTEFPGSEPTAEVAAFLSAASIIFEDENPEYAETLRSHAIDLFMFAYEYQEMYHNSIPGVQDYYFSWNGFYDELTWAATWLHLATGKTNWLDIAQSMYGEHYGSGVGYWTQTWSDKQYGTSILLASITGEEIYKNDAEDWLRFWSTGTNQGDRIQYTQGGLAWLSQWGSLRYAANTAMLGLMYVDLLGDVEDDAFYDFSISQIEYILGENPNDFCFMSGFGTNYPVQPHHGGGSGLFDGNVNWPNDNRHVLYGGLVGGPKSANDSDYEDARGDWVGNEVAIDYNAGFTGALARLAMEYGGEVIPDSAFPPFENPIGEEYFVEASIKNIEDHEVELWCWINNRSAWPARGSTTLSYRVFFDLTELLNAGLSYQDVYTINIYSTGGHVGEMEPWDISNNIYTVKFDYTNRLLIPGAPNTYHKICKVRIGIDDSHPADAWDIANDPSLIGLPEGGTTFEKTQKIPIYESGVLFWGVEPISMR